MKYLKKSKLKPVRKLHKDAWKLMSEYVRRRDKGRCITCPKVDHWKNMHAGHFVHKDCMDFNYENINCQCPQCNKWGHGKLGIYAINLDYKYYPGKAEELIILGNKIKQFKRNELEDIIFELKLKLEGIR